jgi:hypothetical protein
MGEGFPDCHKIDVSKAEWRNDIKMGRSYRECSLDTQTRVPLSPSAKVDSTTIDGVLSCVEYVEVL